MSRAKAFAVICGLAAFASTGVIARAEDTPLGARAEEAAPFFDEGVSAYGRGDFRAAALAFEEAYRRAARGAT